MTTLILNCTKDAAAAAILSAKVDWWAHFTKIGHFFYLVNPNEFIYGHVEKVPNLFQQAWPYFLMFIILENMIRLVEKRPSLRINDTITSFSHGLFQECFTLCFRGAETLIYIYIYDNYRLVDLNWKSPITWYLAALGVDFCYYWAHRAGHEVHILWAQHQVHHSSEDFNLSVGLRQSMLQNTLSSIAYLPLALILSPTLYLTHHQFNLLFQFWIHTEVVDSIGPLEYIFNAPKHHRVHHGSNIYCLDKNYGGVLIIWDRLFGTFQEEKLNEEIIYGLVVQQPSFNPLFLQWFYTDYVLEKMKSMISWRHKLASIFYGPSWVPGRPRLGCDEDKIDVTSRPVYNVEIPNWANAYCVLHFCIILYEFHQISSKQVILPPFWVFVFSLHIMLSLTSIGLLFDNHRHVGVFELIRCGSVLIILQLQDLISLQFIPILQVFFSISAIFWCLHIIKLIQIKKKIL